MDLPKISDAAEEAVAIGVERGDYLVDLMLLGFSQRNVNILEDQGGVQTLEQLVGMTRDDLLEFKNFGNKALLQLFSALARYHELEELRTIKPIEGSKKKRI